MAKTLTDAEFTDLSGAFNTLYTILADMPACMCDMMDEEEYTRVGKASAIVRGAKYNPVDFPPFLDTDEAGEDANTAALIAEISRVRKARGTYGDVGFTGEESVSFLEAWLDEEIGQTKDWEADGT